MKKLIAIAGTLVAFAGVTAVSADDDGVLVGSDTLITYTNSILAQCPNTTITYSGPGSSAGEAQLIAGNQAISPMSRTSRTGNVCGPWTGPLDEAAGQVAAGDGLALTWDVENTQCGTTPGLAFSETLSSGYQLQGWDDALALLYGGKHNDGSFDCNSAHRRALVQSLSASFDGNCSSGECSQLKRVYRRGDVSGTTDVFLGMVGLPNTPQPPGSGVCAGDGSISCLSAADCTDAGTTGPCGPSRPSPFCGGYVYEDSDPIRVECSDDDDVCSSGALKDHTLGLVQGMYTEAGPVDQIYPSDPCTFGAFRRRSGVPLDVGVCRNSPATSCLLASDCPALPNGNPDNCDLDRCDSGVFPQAGFCPTPVRVEGSTVRCDCLNSKGNTHARQTSPNADGRVFNLFLRDASCNIISDALATESGGPRQWTGAKHRMRTRRGVCATDTTRVCNTSSDCGFGDTCRPGICAANNANGQRVACSVDADCTNAGAGNSCRIYDAPGTRCTENDATRQIGCLTGVDGSCAIGFAGVESDASFPENQSLLVNGSAPGESSYPLKRDLYLNTLVGFGNVQTFTPAFGGQLNEFEMLKCYSTPSKMAVATAASNYFPSLPECADLDETACTGQNADACAESTIATCQDGLDNDGDGDTDCADTACQRFPENADGSPLCP